MLSNSKPITSLKAFVAFVKLLRDPNDLAQVFVISNRLRQSERMKELVQTLAQDAGCEAIIRERYQGPTPDLDELLKLPAGSLGHEFARHMKANQLDVVFYPIREVKDDLSYVDMRVLSTHDVWHTVTGIGVDVLGELSLQAFMLAQNATPLAVVFFAGAFIRHTLEGSSPGQPISGLMEALSNGWRLGRAARPLFAQRWEEGWARPLADWRLELGIEVAQSQLAA
jgi:ubiquinone biosynthesis protein COQ4